MDGASIKADKAEAGVRRGANPGNIHQRNGDLIQGPSQPHRRPGHVAAVVPQMSPPDENTLPVDGLDETYWHNALCSMLYALLTSDFAQISHISCLCIEI
jgi:hypothetical protein